MHISRCVHLVKAVHIIPEPVTVCDISALHGFPLIWGVKVAHISCGELPLTSESDCTLHSHMVYTLHNLYISSRHTVMCRAGCADAAQEAVTSPREYIDRKTKNVIFTPT